MRRRRFLAQREIALKFHPKRVSKHALEQYGFVEKLLAGYDSFHTRGFEYMAELLIAELAIVQAA